MCGQGNRLTQQLRPRGKFTRIWRCCCSVSVSQKVARMVRSRAVVMIALPSGVKAAPVIAPACPLTAATKPSGIAAFSFFIGLLEGRLTVALASVEAAGVGEVGGGGVNFFSSEFTLRNKKKTHVTIKIVIIVVAIGTKLNGILSA